MERDVARERERARREKTKKERATDGAVREIAEKWVLQRYKSFLFFKKNS
jgi:hypothetical protein